MSRFFSEKFRDLTPYVPGEQPRDMQYIKLNTNESPFPPSPMAQAMAREEAGKLELYSDPTCSALVAAAAQQLGIPENQIVFGNGSDEILNFAFQAFCDREHPAIFPDITYGFYSVFAQLNGVPYKTIPLKKDFTLDPQDYMENRGTIFIANPNAPTGIALSREQVESILRANPDQVVVIDEAYVDFGGESALCLLPKYENLLVVQTFSKSRSLAGGRLGFGAGSADLIQDLNTIRFSTNPYNINRMTMAAGIGALLDRSYFEENCRKILENRQFTRDELEKLGFTVLDSSTNFVFASHPKVSGGLLYRKLKERGILVRHFDKPRLDAYNRITIGDRQQMEAFLAAVHSILEEEL